MSSVSFDLHFTIFADDTTILTANKSLTYSTNIVSNRLTIVFDCFLANKLTLNIKKTHIMLFGLSKHFNFNSIVVNEHIINRVSNTKFLGLHIINRVSNTKFLGL